MALFQYAFETDFLSYTPTASSQHASYLDDNLKLYRNPGRPWKTNNSVVETYVVCGYGAQTVVAAIVLFDCNFTACYVQGNNTDVWTSPSFRYPTPSGNLTVSKERVTKRYNIFIPVTGLDHNYSRLVIPVQSRTDGAAFFRMGSMIHLATLRTLGGPPEYGIEVVRKGAGDGHKFPTGAEERQTLGPRQASVIMSLGKRQRLTAAEDEIWDLDTDEADLILWYLNQGRTDETWLTRRTGQVKAVWPSHGFVKAGAFIFDEVI